MKKEILNPHQQKETMMLDRKTLIIIAAALLSTVVIIGAMFTIADRFDRRIDLESEITELRAEKAELEALLDQALKTLHHERLMHSGTTSAEMEGRK